MCSSLRGSSGETWSDTHFLVSPSLALAPFDSTMTANSLGPTSRSSSSSSSRTLSFSRAAAAAAAAAFRSAAATNLAAAAFFLRATCFALAAFLDDFGTRLTGCFSGGVWGLPASGSMFTCSSSPLLRLERVDMVTLWVAHSAALHTESKLGNWIDFQSVGAGAATSQIF